MRTLLVAVLLSTSIAAAAPKQKPASPAPKTFSAQVSYKSCRTSTMFACGMQDANGNTYGTAREMTHCEQYTFLPNGTYTNTGIGGAGGTYKIVGSTVEITEQIPDSAPYVYTMPLAADGTTLGGMKRL